MALSRYTADALNKLAGTPHRRCGHADAYRCGWISGRTSARVMLGRIGFAGRFTDPRKNISLLIEAALELRKRDVPVASA